MEIYQIVLIVIGSVLLFFVVLSLVIAYVSYKKALYHEPKLNIKDNIECHMMAAIYNGTPMEKEVKNLIQKAVQYPHEDVYVTSFDKLKLHGVLYRFGDENTPIAICFHGYRGNKFRDFCGGLQILKELGLNVLLVDQRSHNESEGKYLTFGVKESKDVLTWIDKVKDIYGPNCKIVIEGISMGASTVLMATSFEKLPNNVKCVLADCPFSSPFSIFESSSNGYHVPKFLLRFYSQLTGLLFTHSNFAKYDLLKGLKNNHLPILMIHGQKDSIVPVYNSENMKKKYPDLIRLELFPNADHGLSYFDDLERYKKVCKEFLSENLLK